MHMAVCKQLRKMGVDQCSCYTAQTKKIIFVEEKQFEGINNRHFQFLYILLLAMKMDRGV